MGFLFYSVGSEFFSSASPSSIFSKALKRVKADESVSKKNEAMSVCTIVHVHVGKGCTG